MTSLPWFHNILLIEKLKDSAERLWYAQRRVGSPFLCLMEKRPPDPHGSLSFLRVG
jgi:hypothetical protein